MQPVQITQATTDLLDTSAAADFLNLKTKRTLDNWRSLGCGPRFVKIGRAVRYRRSDLLDFIAQNTFQHTGEMAVA